MEKYPELLQVLLLNRNITTPEEVEKFLNPDYERDAHDPFLMKDMEKACVRIFEAMEAKQKILIYADYDADGIPGGTILHDLFKKIGYQNFSVYIPDRHLEGFGLNKEAVEKFKNEDVNLIVTVDLGTADVEAVALAQGFGIDVIITDHHLPGEVLPRAYAILNPKQEGCEYPDEMLCGSGVAFKLVQGFLKKYAEYFKIQDGWEKWLLDMAGLATLADMVPLVGENRVLAFYGMKVIRKNRRLGLQKIFQKLKMNPLYLNEDDITFMVVPRLNAASRMDDPKRAFELLSTTDETEAGGLADHLANINDERKVLVAGMIKEIKIALEKREEKNVIVIGNPKWRVGVLGLAASKIVDEYGKPCFVWGLEGSAVIKGSCRSPVGVNLHELMSAAKENSFLTFGGHELAGGFSVSHEQIHLLEQELLIAYEKIGKEPPLQNASASQADKKLSLEDLTMFNYRLIEKLAPFGVGNPKPVFLFENIEIKEIKSFGKEKNHLEIIFAKENGDKVKAISFFKTPESFDFKLEPGRKIDLAANFEKSMFMGRTELRLRIVDIFEI